MEQGSYKVMVIHQVVRYSYSRDNIMEVQILRTVELQHIA